MKIHESFKTMFLIFEICFYLFTYQFYMQIERGVIINDIQGKNAFSAINDSISYNISLINHVESLYYKKDVLPCMNGNNTIRCYSPQEIYNAYNINSLLRRHIDGKNIKIVIIAAFQDPTILEDLQNFDYTFELNNPKINIIAPFGTTPFNPHDMNQVDFAIEIAVDVEWAHAIAPAATIKLVLAHPTDESVYGQFIAIQKVTKYAVDHNLGDIISQSFGIGETCLSKQELLDEHSVFIKATKEHITLLAASGDSGAATTNCQNSLPITERGVNFPASDPLVTAVGGTRLSLKDSHYLNETAWNDPNSYDIGATAGGFSLIFRLPGYQRHLAPFTSYRGVPDVSYDADITTGFPVIFGATGTPLLLTEGGTSLGSPQWAGIIALADQLAGRRLGFLNNAFYQLSQTISSTQVFHDVIQGNNNVLLQGNTDYSVFISGYKENIGWNPVTGLGTPNVANLLPRLIKLVRSNDGENIAKTSLEYLQ